MYAIGSSALLRLFGKYFFAAVTKGKTKEGYPLPFENLTAVSFCVGHETGSIKMFRVHMEQNLFYIISTERYYGHIFHQRTKRVVWGDRVPNNLYHLYRIDFRCWKTNLSKCRHDNTCAWVYTYEYVRGVSREAERVEAPQKFQENYKFFFKIHCIYWYIVRSQ